MLSVLERKGFVARKKIGNVNLFLPEISILEKDNDEVAKGAAEIAANMMDWTPGRQRGKTVPVNFTLPLKFQ